MLLGLPDFDMVSAESVAEACALLARHDGKARLFAGGTDLLIMMKHRKATPRQLINIKRIAGLDHISYDAEGGLRMGALATVESIKDHRVIGEKYPVLSQAAGLLVTTHVRNLGTLGGNLANASPAAEFAPPLLVLDATVQCAGSTGERTVPMSEFFLAPGKSALRPDEMITEIRVPVPRPGAEAIYLKHSLRRMDVATASAAALVQFDGDACREARVALGAVAPTPFRADRAEDRMRGAKFTGEGADGALLDEVARLAGEQTKPIDDFRGEASYRRRIIVMLLRQGLERVVGRAISGAGNRRR